MPHKTLLRSLLGLQLVLFAMLMLLTSPSFTGQISAQGGNTTEYDIYPNSVWGGVGGELLANASSTVSIVAGEVTVQNVQVSNASCKNRELFAATTAIDAQTITPIEPTVADTIAGIDPQHPHSITRMYNQQQDFNIAGQTITLWSTQTQGQIANFPQAVALSEGKLVFVTTAQGLAKGYDGENINYQYLLPSGVWTISDDQADTCLQIEDPPQPESINESFETTYQIVVPRRICSEQEFPSYAVQRFQRTYCEIEDIGPGCRPVAEQDISFGTQSYTSNKEGEATILINDPGTYVVSATVNNQGLRRTITVNDCLAQSTATPDSTIQLGEPDVNLADLNIPQLQEPNTTKEELAVGVLTAMTGITVLIMIITTLYLIAKRDEIKFVLKIRIWLLEKFR